MRQLLPITLCLLISACSGWQAVHVATKDTATPDHRLGQIHLDPVYSVTGQNMYNALLDRLAKFQQAQASKYTLTYSISISSKTQTAFTDGSASVALRRYIVNYRLQHGKKQQDFSSTTATTISTDSSPFNNSELEEKADEQAVAVLADTIVRRIAAFLRQHPDW